MLRAGRPGFDSRQDFFFSTSSRPTLEPTQLPIQWVPGGWAISPGVKRPGRGADLRLMPRSRIVEIYLYFPTRIHGVVLN
jgi:hypothetical protein